MRRIGPILLAALLPATGCSALVAGRGVNVNELSTKDEVRQAFGTPAFTCDEFHDEFRTHRKLAEQWKLEYLAMPAVITLGLSEVVLFPTEVYCAAKQRIRGAHVRFFYDENGKVTYVLVDGERPILSPHRSLPGSEPPPESPQTASDRP
ncbi:hypothetical protein [Gemmata sp.]|uniref:hypothetical protein n=1 Tax=Gemmata sp. TaxID=1914242 RepID=UPI003F72B86C